MTCPADRATTGAPRAATPVEDEADARVIRRVLLPQPGARPAERIEEVALVVVIGVHRQAEETHLSAHSRDSRDELPVALLGSGDSLWEVRRRECQVALLEWVAHEPVRAHAQSAHREDVLERGVGRGVVAQPLANGLGRDGVFGLNHDSIVGLATDGR